MEYNWTDVLQGIGSIASAIISLLGFIFIYMQIKQAKHAVVKQNNASVYNLGVNLNTVIFENSELMPFVDGETEMLSTDPNYPKLTTLVEMMADYYEYIICERNSIDTKITEGWVTYLRDNIRNRKMLREYILARKKYYSKEFIDEINSIVEQIKLEEQVEKLSGETK